MIYKFRFLSGEKDDFIRDIEIKANQTFFDLHTCLRESTGFVSNEITSFFTTTDCWQKEQEITLIEMEDTHPSMENTLLEEFIKKEKQKLLYVFDYFNERTFFAELVTIKDEESLKIYPSCVFSQGEAPAQTIEGEIIL